MAKMTKAQILEETKKTVIGGFTEVLKEMDSIQVGDFEYAIPVIVGGEIERWAKITITAKDTITDDEGNKVDYAPEIEIDRWQFKKADQKERAEERKRKHDEAVKRAEERRAKAKAKANAKKDKAE
jgi:hypothetical protein